MLGKFFLTLCAWNILTKYPTTHALKFPDDFLFGVATSSYQIEGAWNVDGKGENIWDRLTHSDPDAILNKDNGDDAAKSYYFYKEDIDLLKEIGFNLYRFSISWARILPNGDLSKINPAGIQYYNNVINYLLEKNIQPMITIYHWDLPQKLQDAGGWLNPTIVDHMEHYADILFKNYGDRVKWWTTINEPYFIVFGYSEDDHAPALGLGSPADYRVSHHILLSHMRIYRLYEKKYKAQQNGKVSITLNYDACFPKTKSPEDAEAVKRYFEFNLGIFAHPIFSSEGDYPKLVREIVYNNSKAEGLTMSRLPAFTEEEKKSLKGAADFFSLNHYLTYICSPLPANAPENITLPFYKDMNVMNEEENSKSQLHFFKDKNATNKEENTTSPETKGEKMEVKSEGFRSVLNSVSKAYNYPAIIISENGLDDGEMNDTVRINYYRDYLNQLLLAKYDDKCNITGYTVWSLLDNFEWNLGYTNHYGIVSVDQNSANKTRTRRQSSYFFQSLIANRTLS
ncbi:myrosinase 1-like [Planococcus citri]|uniref:myrosinase 1-like n=1 Tax=Planococcus citri TaxID=170843 RepID=UPI0031F970FF